MPATDAPAGALGQTFARFKRDPSPALLDQALEQTAGDPQPLAEARRAWLEERLSLLGAYLGFFEFVERERDPAFAENGKLVLKVIPPSEDREAAPKAWADYQRRKEQHALEAARFRLQYHLERADGQALVRAERLIATHFLPTPADAAALWARLGHAAVSEERKQRLAGLSARARPAVTKPAQRESTQALAGMLESLRATRDPDRLYQWLAAADQAGAALMARREEFLRLRRAGVLAYCALLSLLDSLLEPGFQPGLPPALPPGFHSSTVSDPAARARHQAAVVAARTRRDQYQQQLWLHQCAERAVSAAAQLIAAVYESPESPESAESAPKEQFELEHLLEGAPLREPRRAQLRAALAQAGRNR